MHSRTLLVSLVIGLAVSFAGCGGGEREDGGSTAGSRNELVIAFDGGPTHLDSRVGNDQYSGRIADLVYAALLQITPDADYEPDVAERWETPDDTTIVFHLRDGVRFQNGEPLTARDVVYTYQSLMAEDFPSAKKAGYQSVASIEAPDDRTVIFRLKEPNAAIFDNLTLGIVPEGADHEAFQTSPIGAGAYRVVEFRTDERVVLEAFDGYYRGAPAIKRVVIRVVPDATTRVLEVQKGSVHFVLNGLSLDMVQRFQNNKQFEVLAEPGSIYQYLAFNLRNQYLKNESVRQAIAHAIERERIVRDLLLGFGRVTDTLFPPDHWAYADNLQTFAYDPDKARRLLDAAGFRDPDGDGPASRFTLRYKTSTDAEANQQAEMIQQMLKQVGIEVEIQSNEFGVFYEDITKGNFEIFSLRRAGVNDPDFYTYMFHSANLPPEGQNRGYYQNARVDQLLDQARTTMDRDQRTRLYQEVQQILARELPYISLYHRSNIAVMDAGLDGFVMYPAGFLLSMPKMKWEE